MPCRSALSSVTLILAIVALAGCSAVAPYGRTALGYAAPGPSDVRYAAFEDGGHAVPAIPETYLGRNMTRTEIA